MVTMITIDQQDSILWDGLHTEIVTMSIVWSSIRTRGATPSWVKMLWNSLAIPKFSFTSWLAIKNRFLTKERMARYGMNTDLSCVVCANNVETNDHMFCTCEFVTTIICIMDFNLTNSWHDYLNGQFFRGSHSKMKELLNYLQ